jgi:hypothetical protein
MQWVLQAILMWGFVAEARSPDDCWNVMDYDLAEWPEGIQAAESCTNKFPEHFEQPIRASCEIWADMLRDRTARLDFTKRFLYTEWEALWFAARRWVHDECHMTRGDELLRYAERQKAQREAEWACGWEVEEINEKRRVAGQKEIDEDLCWSWAGGERWKDFYEGP